MVATVPTSQKDCRLTRVIVAGLPLQTDQNQLVSRCLSLRHGSPGQLTSDQKRRLHIRKQHQIARRQHRQLEVLGEAALSTR
jgi:hypothetical protein